MTVNQILPKALEKFSFGQKSLYYMITGTPNKFQAVIAN